MPKNLPAQLQERAESIPDSDTKPYETLGKLQGVDVLTDGLMILALMAVERCTEVKPEAQKRLLARLIADVVGAQVTLSNQRAGGIGLRLRKQARFVRAKIAMVVADALGERTQARAVAGGDEALAAALPTKLAELAALEQAELDRLRLEVYDGYNEIKGAPVKMQQSVLGAAATQEQPAPPLPRWLRDDCRLSHLPPGQGADRISQVLSRQIDEFDLPVEWPTDEFDLPPYVRVILEAFCKSESDVERAQSSEKIYLETQKKFIEIDVAFESDAVKRAEKKQAEWSAAYNEARDECTYLEFEVERAKGREEALHRAVKRAYQCKSK